MGELVPHGNAEIRLREALARDEALLLEKDELLRQQELLLRESDHRLLNDLQMIVSLLSLQSRNSTNVEAASQLGVAANRVNMIVRVHQRLHGLKNVKAIAFNHYLEELCDDFATILSSGARSVEVQVTPGMEINLPATKALRLGFIVCELLTNAAKHGSGLITVKLEPDRGSRFALSVINTGQPLPAGFDPDRCNGLGMKIIRSFVAWLEGDLQFGRGSGDQGARFTVLFSAGKAAPAKR